MGIFDQLETEPTPSIHCRANSTGKSYRRQMNQETGRRNVTMIIRLISDIVAAFIISGRMGGCMCVVCVSNFWGGWECDERERETCDMKPYSHDGRVDPLSTRERR
jgi:hypothetical protein